MREWFPVSTSPKGRLVLAAVREFGARPYDSVTVGELSSAAEVTTGALYHHFGSKLAIYAVVRTDVERRLLDRMEGAVAAARATDPVASAVVRAALLVGFDFAVREGFTHLLGAPPHREQASDAESAGGPGDPLAEFLATLVASGPPMLGGLLAAAWRAALAAVAAGADPAATRVALGMLSLDSAA